MSLPNHARCVVIGCGIVGNSLAYHLTRLGWRDVVLLDKGPLPNPGGSTGHASNFIYLVDHSKEMTALTMDSVRQYKELGVFIQSGGIDVEHGRVKRVRTTDGDIETDIVAITGGVWSPRIARMAGTRIPLTPAVHQMIDIGPVPRFRGAKSDIEHPIVRDMDTNMYERQAGGDLEIGSYAHKPILYDPEDLPPVEQAALSPTEFPFTQADFEEQMQHALELMPEIVGDESVGVKYAINGILSLTPDGMPVLGESPDVKGLWAAAAVWVKEGQGTGKAVAEWMVHGESEIDLHSSDIARFHEHQKTRAHVRARAAEGFNKTYGIVHPSEQWASNRNVRLAPFHIRERELGAVFFEAAGWERPQWYESNASLLEEFGDRVTRRSAEWDARWWSPIINAEHLAMRDRAGLFDLSAFTIFDILGPGALASVQCAALRQMDVPIGRVVYTPVLSPQGGFKSDLTIMRLGDEHFRVVTGGAGGMADRKWFREHTVRGAGVGGLTPSKNTTGLGGPRARRIRTHTAAGDGSNEGFQFGTCRVIEVGTQRVLASRISYVGDLGWELYVPIEQGLKLWDTLWEAGRPHGMAACGIGVYGTTGRLEKCYRAHGNELETEYNVVEAGMTAPRGKEEDFIGKTAHLRHREEDPAAVPCTLTPDDHRAKAGGKPYPPRRRPIPPPDGRRSVRPPG